MPSSLETSILLHCNGTENSTTIVDSSTYAKTVTAFGAVSITQVNPALGNGSLNFSGAISDYVVLPYDETMDFGTGDFTIDFRVRLPRSKTQTTVLSTPAWYNEGTTYLYEYNGSLTFMAPIHGTSRAPFTAENIIVANTWTHVALVRYNGVCKFYVNGQYVTTTDEGFYSGKSIKLGSAGDSLRLGAEGVFPYAGAEFNGQIDEFRVLKGVAAWTSNFDVPASEYDSSAQILSLTAATRGSMYTVTADATAISALPIVVADSYFSDPSNWERVVFMYDSPSHHDGDKKMSIRNNGANIFSESMVPFSVNADVSAGGVWTCTKIRIMNYDGEYFMISGTDLPEGLDITVS